MQYFNFDIWTPNTTAVQAELVDFGANNAYGGGDDVQGIVSLATPPLTQFGWVHYSLPLSAFVTAGLATRAHLSQLLFVGTSTTIYLENVYFSVLSTLPVSLVDFKANKRNNTTLLTWSTASEQNNKGFSVERSLDGLHWKAISFINSTNSPNGSRYSATDLTPAAGIDYYRLKQVDVDGNANYSNVVSLNFDAKSAFQLSFYPNPAKGQVTMKIGCSAAGAAYYAVMSGEGKVLKTGIVGLGAGTSNHTLDISDLPAGSYFVRVSINGIAQKTAALVVE